MNFYYILIIYENFKSKLKKNIWKQNQRFIDKGS